MYDGHDILPTLLRNKVLLYEILRDYRSSNEHSETLHVFFSMKTLQVQGHYSNLSYDSTI